MIAPVMITQIAAGLIALMVIRRMLRRQNLIRPAEVEWAAALALMSKATLSPQPSAFSLQPSETLSPSVATCWQASSKAARLRRWRVR
jgi:hypothetical protein